mgnify:CR=1 FL=1
MSKSTPINQLPSQASNPTFVNEQQRQMITQAQQAIGNSAMPQNTQLPAEILTEDDSVIQDMLNNLNAPSDVPSAQQEELLRLAAMNQYQMPQMSPYPQQYAYAQPVHVPKSFSAQFTHLLTSEFKLAGLVFVIVLIVQFVPFHRYVSKYVAIDKIPYHEVLLRAIIAALAVIAVKKLLN